MKRDFRFEITLNAIEKKKLKLLAAYCGLDSWLSPAAHVRGVLYWMWREIYSLDRLTPDEAQKWLADTIEAEQVGRFSGYGYSAQFDRKRVK